MRLSTVLRSTAFALVLAIPFSAAQLFAARAPGARSQEQGASIAGTASSNTGQTLANYTVQLRNLATGQLTGTTTSSAAGGFSFAGLPAGNFAIEVVNAAGQIIGTSASISVTLGATITGVAVSATSAIVGAAAAAGGAAAAGAGAAAGVSTAVIVTTVAAAAGVAGAASLAQTNASPSR